MIAERASTAPAATAASARRRVAHPLRWTLFGIALVAVLALALQPWWLAPLVAHRLFGRGGRCPYCRGFRELLLGKVGIQAAIAHGADRQYPQPFAIGL